MYQSWNVKIEEAQRLVSNNEMWEEFISGQSQDFELELYAIDIFPNNPELWTYQTDREGSKSIPDWTENDLSRTFMPNDREPLVFFPQEVTPTINTEEYKPRMVDRIEFVSPHIGGNPLNWHGMNVLTALAKRIFGITGNPYPGREVNSIAIQPMPFSYAYSKLAPYEDEYEPGDFLFDEDTLKQIGVWQPHYHPTDYFGFTDEQREELSKQINWDAPWIFRLLDEDGMHMLSYRPAFADL